MRATWVAGVLAVPVAVCLLPVFGPQASIAWSATAALFALSVVGVSASGVASEPTWTDLLGFFWPVTILAAVATGRVQAVHNHRNMRAARRSAT